MAPGIDVQTLNGVLDSVYAYSRRQLWRGWNKHDGLNSPLLSGTFGKLGRWPRMVAIQGIMRFPVNLRPWLLTPKVYNPKGLALFTMGLLCRYQASADERYLAEARELLALLVAQKSPGEWAGNCWGYHYPWQDPGFYAPTNTPNAVVTSFVCEAFLMAWEMTGETDYLDVVRSACEFFDRHLTVLRDTPEELCFSYMPMPMTMRVMDVSVLIGAVMAGVARADDDAQMANKAARLVRFVAERQTDYGAWFYTDPPGDSHIRHDNYHTGFILDALDRYMRRTGEDAYVSHYETGLEFYARELFNADGAPRWMSDKDFPHDIHGAAQGVLTFARHLHNYPELADRVAAWALDNMFHSEGRFYYQQGRFWTTRFTLLRWCNGWMALSLAALVAAKSSAAAVAGRQH